MSHTPDNVVADEEGWLVPPLTSNVHLDVGLGGLELLDGYPNVEGHLFAGLHRRSRGEAEDERSNNDGRKDAGSRMQVVEFAEQDVGGQRNTRLLFSLAPGGCEQLPVLRIPPPSGECHLPRPWISTPLCAFDQQQRQLVAPYCRSEDERDRRLDGSGFSNTPWRSASKAIADYNEIGGWHSVLVSTPR